jgi:hypothetical protein
MKRGSIEGAFRRARPGITARADRSCRLAAALLVAAVAFACAPADAAAAEDASKVSAMTERPWIPEAGRAGAVAGRDRKQDRSRSSAASEQPSAAGSDADAVRADFLGILLRLHRAAAGALYTDVRSMNH